MGDKFPCHIKTGQLDSVSIFPDPVKHLISDPVRSIPVRFSGKSPVDVDILHPEKTLVHIQAQTIDHRNHKYPFIYVDPSMSLQFFQFPDKLGADIHLLYLVSPDRPKNTGRRISFSEPVPLYHHVLPVRGRHPAYFFLIHIT